MAGYTFSNQADTACISVGNAEIREAILNTPLAGTWYEANPKLLKAQFDQWCASAETGEIPEQICAVIQPHAGYAYAGPAAAYAVKVLRGKSYRRAVILGPSHYLRMKNELCIPSFDGIRTPFGTVKTDHDALQQLQKNPFVRVSNEAHREEHSVQIQLPLLQYALKDSFTVVPVIAGQLDEDGVERAASAIRELLDEETLLVISSDFTHFGRAFQYCPFRDNFAENLKKLDLGAFELIQQGNLAGFTQYIRDTGATICGESPIRILLRLAGKDQKMKLLHYTTSSAESGDYSHCVSYLSACMSGVWKSPEFLTAEEKQTLLSMARRSIEYVFQHREVTPDGLFRKEATDAMKKVAGCFVTLNIGENLRGCIGEIQGYRPLYEGVTGRAVDAAFRDPRFSQLTPAELKQVTIEISVLTPARPVGSWKEIQIGKHGMTLSLHGRSAVFLPQVAPEQGWNLETTLTYLSRKAELPADAWKAPQTKFTVFEAIVFKEGQGSSR